MWQSNVAAVAGALDVKNIGSNVGRIAREGDFDWEMAAISGCGQSRTSN